MQNRFKTALAIFILLLSTPSQAQLLWKIEATKTTKESYLFGTHHLYESAILTEIKGLGDALKKSTRIIGEIDIKEMQNPSSMVLLSKMIMLEGDTLLSNYLSKEDFDRVMEFASKTLGNKYPQQFIEKIKPIMLNTLLLGELYKTYAPGKGVASTDESIDIILQQKAIEQGKKTGGLETLKFQLNLIYSNSGNKKSAEDIVHLIDCLEHSNYIKESLLLLNQLYIDQDIEGMYQMSQQKDTECKGMEFDPKDWTKTVDKRNEDWVEQIPALMEDENNFFAVGALHLPGESGLIQLLRNKGYKLTPISK